MTKIYLENEKYYFYNDDNKLYLPTEIKALNDDFFCLMIEDGEKFRPYYISKANVLSEIKKYHGEEKTVVTHVLCTDINQKIVNVDVKVFVLDFYSSENDIVIYIADYMQDEDIKQKISYKLIVPQHYNNEKHVCFEKLISDNKKILLFNRFNYNANNYYYEYMNQKISNYKNGILVNSISAIKLSTDKWVSYLHLKDAKIPTPHTQLHELKYFFGKNFEEKDFPFFIKTIDGCGGFGVKYFKNKTEFGKWILLVGHIKNFSSNFFDNFKTNNSTAMILRQKPVLTSLGRCVRVLVANNKIIASYIRQSTDGNEKANVCQGAKIIPYKMNAEWKKVVLKTHKMSGLDISGIDVLFGENEQPIICEINGYPGYSGAYKCGVDPVVEILCQYLNKIRGIK